MKKKRKTDVFNKQINKQKEWQEHQYDPGYYTGGNIHPVFVNPGKPKIFGWFLIIMSVILAIIMMFVFKSIFQIKDILQISILVILFYGLMLLQFIGGLRLIKRSMSTDSFTRIKKKLLIFSCCVASIVVLLTFLNECFLEKKSSININDVKSIKLIQENDKNYVMINDGELVLNCKFSDYHDIWEIKVTDSKASFWIQYEWNLLHPDKGKITKIQVIK